MPRDEIGEENPLCDRGEVVYMLKRAFLLGFCSVALILILGSCANTSTPTSTSPETTMSTPTPTVTTTSTPISTPPPVVHRIFNAPTATISIDVPQDWVVDDKTIIMGTEDAEIAIYDSTSRANVTITSLAAGGKTLMDFVDLYKDALDQWGRESNVGASVISETPTEVDGNPAVSMVYLAPEYYNGIILKDLAVMFQEKSFYLIECSAGQDLYDGFYEQFNMIINSMKIEGKQG